MHDYRKPLALFGAFCGLMMSVMLALYALSSPATQTPQQEPSRIVVLHSYGSSHPNYAVFDSALVKSLQAEGLAVDVENVYLNVADLGYTDSLRQSRAIARAIAHIVADSLPDLIMVEDDKAMWAMLTYGRKLISSVPVVAGGLCHSQWNVLHRYENICGFYEEPDYVDNIEMATMLWGRHMAPLLGIKSPERFIVNVGLDYTREDSLVRSELHSAIARPAFADYSLRPAYDALQAAADIPVGTIMVMATSLRDPASNVSDADVAADSTLSWRALSSIMANSSKFVHLQVVKDEFGECVAASSGLPQFTMLRSDFANGKRRFLAGRFASYQTVAQDMASVAALVLAGHSPVSIGFSKHDTHFYMDYQVMSSLGLDYDDFSVDGHGTLRSNYFIILGAPERLVSPWKFGMKFGMCFLAIAILVVHLMQSIFRMRLTVRQLAMESIAQDEELAQLALPHGSCHVLYWNEGTLVVPYNLEEYREIIIDEMVQLSNSIKATKEVDNPYVYSRDMLLGEGDDAHWWQLRCSADPTIKDWLLVDIDYNVRWAANLAKAQESANKALAKGQFLQNVSHEIRTPLNAIIGFSEIIATMPISTSEREDLGRRVLHSSRQLMQLVTDVLTVSRIETHHSKMEEEPAPTNISSLMTEVVEDWRAKGTDLLKDLCEVVPGGGDVDFRVQPVRDNVWAICAPMHIRIALDRIIHNAFKFTPSGSVTISWGCVLEAGEVEIFVEDSGVGIASESRSHLYEVFFKEDVFVQGAGLGLTIAKELVDRMGGRLVLRSEKFFGTRVSIFLPICAPQTEQHHATSQPLE